MVKLEDLKPGLYRTTQDAKNPQLDKRVNSDWRAMPLREGAVFMFIERDEIDRSSTGAKSTRLSLQPSRFGTYLPGVQYESTHSIIVGWRYGDRVVPRDAEPDTLVTALLSILEPMPVTNVDQALALFNAQAPHHEIGWRDIALQLMRETGPAVTADIFTRVAARVAAQWDLDESTSESPKRDAADEAFSQGAYKAAPPPTPAWRIAWSCGPVHGEMVVREFDEKAAMMSVRRMFADGEFPRSGHPVVIDSVKKESTP